MRDDLSPEPAAARDSESALSLFSESTSVTGDGEMVIGGVRLAEIARSCGTPAYVIDVADFRRQARRFTEGLAARWPHSEVLFASKAFPALAMYELAADAGLSIDVAGAGEIVFALAAGVNRQSVYFHGNAKTDAELSRALEAGVGTIVIDNADELERLLRLASRPQGVMVRVIPGIAPQTHPSQSTGGHDSKFGLPLDQALDVIARIRASEQLRLDGVHLHIGSQVLAAEPFAEAVRQVSVIGDQAAYNIGGGLGARYTYDEHPPTIEEYLDTIVDAARQVLPAHAKLLIEPGRALVARAGTSLYTIVSVKRTGRTFVAVDGGMADNMDISLTGQRYEAVIVGRADRAGTVRCDVVGRQCESGDRLIAGIDLPDPVVGDLLAVPVTGAYSYTMANNYNGAPRPPVVFVEAGRARTVVRRETFDEMLSPHLSMR
ncbi:MAG: diaminopimelate decarboxylase [Trebonia sp.]